MLKSVSFGKSLLTLTNPKEKGTFDWLAAGDRIKFSVRKNNNEKVKTLLIKLGFKEEEIKYEPFHGIHDTRILNKVI